MKTKNKQTTEEAVRPHEEVFQDLKRAFDEVGTLAIEYAFHPETPTSFRDAFISTAEHYGKRLDARHAGTKA